jgi:hypothetical protein
VERRVKFLDVMTQSAVSGAFAGLALYRCSVENVPVTVFSHWK